MEECIKFDLSKYIKQYEGKTYANFNYDYTYDHYLKPELRKFCKEWYFKFNYANNALKKINEIKADNAKITRASDKKKTD